MVYKGVIFDLDGTLADTLADIGDSMNRVLTGNGFPPHPVSEYKSFIGRGLENLVISALPEGHRSSPVISACLSGMMEDYGKNCLVRTRLYDGIREMLGELRDKGLKLGIFSNKADELTQIIVRALLSDYFFELVLGASPAVPKKPDPAGALLIGKKMGISPANIIYMGDSDVDMKTAVKAGMLAAGALWGFRSAGELQENGAAVLLGSPGELLDIIDGVVRLN